MILPLIILYSFAFIGLLIAANKHGQPRDEDFNFWNSFLAWTIQFILIWWALGWVFW